MMAKKEITITFKTITPLWAGDAWQNNGEIRSSSLMGSLRFWFETIMYFADIINGKDFNPQNGRFEKEVNRKELRNFRLKNGNDVKEIINHLLHEQKIPISSVIFGTTNWRSLIEIKGIEPINGYCFGNHLNLPYAIGVKKSDYTVEVFNTEDEWKEKVNTYQGNAFKDKLKEAKKEFSFFFLSQPYFYGKFKVKFLLEQNIVDSIFYPLLTFMDKYGFWGGKWSIGYGRLKVESVEENNSSKFNWRKSDFELPNGICFSWNGVIDIKNINKNSLSLILKKILQVSKFYCNRERDFAEKTKSMPKKVIVIDNLISNKDLKSLIQELIVEKVKIRDCLRHPCEEKKDINGEYTSVFQKECFKDKNFIPEKEITCNEKEKQMKALCSEINKWRNFRHKLLGEQGEGSKILPFIEEENNQLKGGFLSIAGLLNLEGRNNG